MTLLTRWEPLREFSAMQNRMNRMNRRKVSHGLRSTAHVRFRQLGLPFEDLSTGVGSAHVSTLWEAII